MKKIFFLSLAVLISVASFSQFKFKGVGAGLAVGTKAAVSGVDGTQKMGFGINVKGLAQITEQIDAEVAFTYYFPSSISEDLMGSEVKVDFTLMTLNVNGHYNFLSNDNLTAYGLAGLNMSMASVEATVAGFSASDSETKYGLNIGAGGAYGIMDNIDLTGDLGYTIGSGDYSQLFINVGVLYKF
jgi:outer membrane autotransporter protein